MEMGFQISVLPGVFFSDATKETMGSILARTCFFGLREDKDPDEVVRNYLLQPFIFDANA
jgi:hypothetical protein